MLVNACHKYKIYIPLTGHVELNLKIVKLKYFILSLIATAFLSSYITDSNSINVGDAAPKIIKSDNSSISLKKDKDHRILINFWSPEIPASRILNKEYSNYLKANPVADIEFISICLDSDDYLSAEIIKNDEIISSGTHLLYSDVNNRVFKDYDVEDYPRSFLISADGKINSISPSIIDLSI